MKKFFLIPILLSFAFLWGCDTDYQYNYEPTYQPATTTTTQEYYPDTTTTSDYPSYDSSTTETNNSYDTPTSNYEAPTNNYNDDYDTPSGCCKMCSKGKACGDSCISRSYTCHKGPGCACDSY